LQACLAFSAARWSQAAFFAGAGESGFHAWSQRRERPRMLRLLAVRARRRLPSMRTYLTLNDPVLPLQHPRLLIETAAAQGAPRKQLLEHTGIDATMLRDPYARISYQAFGALTVNALRLTNNPALGIDFGRRAGFTSLGMTGLAMAASATVEQALRTHLRFGAIFAPAWDAKLRVAGRHAIISAASVLPFGPLRAFGAEALVAAMIGMVEGLRSALRELRFDYKAPEHVARYVDIAAVPMHFSQRAIEIVFDSAALTVPLSSADPLTYELAVRQCELDLARLPDRRRLVSAVRELIDPGDGRYASHESVASALGMSARALRRALKDLGTSYQTLLDERRRDNTVRRLRDSNISLESAATELGFSDVRSLRRSVRRWTGLSLQELRAEAQGAPPTAD
jgi:AraC-like DNA-binding protein